MRHSVPLIIVCLLVVAAPGNVRAAELKAETVLDSIDRAKQFLISQQNDEGNGMASWTTGPEDRYKVGVTSLVTMALINAGMKADDGPIQKALKYLRDSKEAGEVEMTYEVSLMIMALAAAKDGNRDRALIFALAKKLEAGQLTKGENAGSWSYGTGKGGLDLGGDRSNGQFAVLGLRDAAQAGIPIDRNVWERVRKHWILSQTSDGGWNYNGGPATGSMTVAGIATLVITGSMLRDDGELKDDGTPVCCNGADDDDQPLERGIKWLERNFSVTSNPRIGTWYLYYMYGLERAGRLSGRRFFGDHDWYREGAEFLINGQSARFGGWSGARSLEVHPIVGTSFALLFLSKGLAPVLINKIQFPSAGPDEAAAKTNWNQHKQDVRNITDLITGLKRWPKLLTFQTVDIEKLVQTVDDGRGVQDRPAQESVRDLLQSPIAYFSGTDRPAFTDQHVELLREYVNQGGFIFAVNCCNGAGFEEGIYDLVARMYPDGDAELKRLQADHPIFRSEYPLDAAGVELYGVDFGCRTAIVFSPQDLSCYWDRWTRYDPPGRPQNLKTGIVRATNIGVNVIAYATGREPLNKLEQQELAIEGGVEDKIERGLIQIAKLRHTGGWDAAPRALRNILTALNRTAGTIASTKPRDLPATDPNIYRYPVLYMHGRYRFEMSAKERENLKQFLSRGNVLFVDACCGSAQFDLSFRKLMAEMFPNHELKRIDPKHELFSNEVGYDLSNVRRRTPEAKLNQDAALNALVQQGPAFLEGIELDGRLAVIYSKYDLSCALERQASVACSGYIAEDAAKIAINIVRYALLQDVSYSELMK